MDGAAAIEHNRQALKRILAAIVAMAGLAGPGSAVRVGGDAGKTLPRRLHLAVLRLLRPAEAAARRLIIATARGLAVTLPPLRPRKASAKIKVSPTILRSCVGTGIVLRPGLQVVAAPARPLASIATARPLAFALTDPPRWWRRGHPRPVANGIPRIGVPGVTARLAVPDRRPPAPDDPVDAARLGRRLDALGRALDDLAGQARRFARWQAQRDRSLARGFARRRSPLRSGRPPGGRLSRYDPLAARRRNVREVDEVLAHAHALALYALERPDTS
jgi:hypothetical protein